MDAYFANVEARDNPDLRKIPFAVGTDKMIVSFFRQNFKVYILFLVDIELLGSKIWCSLSNARFVLNV